MTDIKMEINSPTVDTWTETNIKVVKYRHEWTINNFSFCKENFSSSTFATGINNEIEWCLTVCPYGLGEEKDKDCVSLFLVLVSEEIPEVRAKFKFSVLNDKKQSTYCREIHEVRTFLPQVKERDYGFRPYIKREVLLDEAQGLLPGDKLTILCEVAVVTEVTFGRGPRNLQQFQVPECQLHNGLGILLETKKFSDVTLAVNGIEFHAHKNILVAASPVFAAMFEHEMAERERNRVEITDIDHEALSAMLRFIYTEKVPDLKKMAGDLLSVCDKYDLQRLKVMCEKALFENLTIENAAYTLKLADFHNSYLLKGLVIDFINTHTTDVMDTEGFKAIVNSHPHLVAEVLRALAVKKNDWAPMKEERN